MKKLLFALFAITLLFTSCEKEVPDYPIEGLWIGTYGIVYGHEDAGRLYYSFDIQSDHSILVQGQGADGNTYYAKGTWALAGSKFTASIMTLNLSQAGVVQNIVATYSPTSKKLQGTVEHETGEFKAEFTLERTN